MPVENQEPFNQPSLGCLWRLAILIGAVIGIGGAVFLGFVLYATFHPLPKCAFYDCGGVF